jgi:hypothetical protein
MVVLLLCANCMGCTILNATPEYDVESSAVEAAAHASIPISCCRHVMTVHMAWGILCFPSCLFSSGQPTTFHYEYCVLLPALPPP